MNVDGLFDSAMNLFAGIMSNGTYDILRPDYSDDETAESTIASKIGIPVDPASANIEAKIAGVDYYVIALPVSRVEVGDVIVPNPARPGVPAVTVRSKDGGGKDIIAFRTDEIGKIMHQRDNIEYENVRYGILNMLNPEQAIVPEFEGTPGFVLEKIAFYTRSTVRIGRYLLMQNGRLMQLLSVETIGPIMIATAREVT